MSDANTLLKLIESLNYFARAIDDKIDSSENPYSSECRRLRRQEQGIVDYANDIAGIAAQKITLGIAQQVENLKAQIDYAKETLAEIEGVKKIIGIVGAVVSVAAAIASGGALGSVVSVASLVQQVSEAVESTKSG